MRERLTLTCFRVVTRGVLRLENVKPGPEPEEYKSGGRDEDEETDEHPDVDRSCPGGGGGVLAGVEVLGVDGERGGAVWSRVPGLADTAQHRVAEEGVRGASAGGGAVLSVVSVRTEVLTAVAGVARGTLAPPVHRVTLTTLQTVAGVGTVRTECSRRAGSVTEVSCPSPWTPALSSHVVTVPSPAGADRAAVRAVVTWRAGLHAVVPSPARTAVTGSSGGMAGVRGVAGRTDLSTVQSEGSRLTRVLALGAGVPRPAPAGPSARVTGVSVRSTVTLETAVLAPGPLLTDGVTGRPPPPVPALALPRHVVTAQAVPSTLAPVLAVQAVAPGGAGLLTENSLVAWNTHTVSSLLFALALLAGAPLLAVLPEGPRRTGHVTVGPGPA